MRVLHISKFGWRKGGAEAYMLRACAQLAARDDVEVALWGAEPAQIPGVRGYDVAIADFHETHGVRGRLEAAATVIWSKEAQRKLAAVLDDFQPDVAHLHLYAHHFSSSILPLLEDRGVAVVATAHDYKLICPAYLAVRNGHDCFACANRLSLVSVRDRCLHGKTSWSTIALAEGAVVRRRGLVPGTVLAPSQFMFDRLGDSWLRDRTSLHLLRYAADPSGVQWRGDGDYLLYAGRLSREKGVDDLIVRAHELGLPLVIAGDGLERPHLEALAAGKPGITFEGYVEEDRLGELRAGCLAQVVPSNWPENYPLTSLEAGVDGIPLIVAARGGTAELLSLGARGSALDGSDLVAWQRALAAVDDQRRSYDPADLERLRDTVSWRRHVPELLTIYEEAIGGRDASAARVEEAVR